MASKRRRLTTNNHHTIHSQRMWEVYPAGERIRTNPSLIVNLPVEIHDELHRETIPIPVLGFHALMFTARNFEAGKNHEHSMTNLMQAIWESNKHPKTHPIERKLALLSIESINLERQFLMEHAQRIMTARF